MAEEKKDTRPTKRVADPEIQAMAAIDEALSDSLNGLTKEAQQRVMKWVRERYFPTPEIAGE